MIYLIGKLSGAARTNDTKMAEALIIAGGYYCCSEAEYYQRLRDDEALDVAIAESGDGGRHRQA